jgi:hypothetical protein
MKRLPRALTLVALLFTAALAPAAESSKAAPKKAKAPNPVLAAVTDVPGLPRVLLIGDSISMGYTLDVRADSSPRRRKANRSTPSPSMKPICGRSWPV